MPYLSHENQTPRSDSTNFKPLEFIFCPKFWSPAQARAHGSAGHTFGAVVRIALAYPKREGWLGPGVGFAFLSLEPLARECCSLSARRGYTALHRAPDPLQLCLQSSLSMPPCAARPISKCGHATGLKDTPVWLFEYPGHLRVHHLTQSCTPRSSPKLQIPMGYLF